MFKLGEKLKDKVSGISGICVSRTEFLNGCVRYSLQPLGDTKKGTMPSEVWFDQQQLVKIGEGVKMKQKQTGGPTSSVVPKGAKA